jgi:hypothetical protein
MGSRGFTAIVDISISGYNNWQRFFDFGNNNVGGQYIFLAAGGVAGVVRFAMGTPAGGAEVNIDTGTVGNTTQFTTFYMALNTRYRLAAVYDPAPGTTGLMMLYVDGTLVQTLIPPVHMLDTTFQRTWVGRSQYNDSFLGGTLYGLSMYNTVLTARQIQNYTFTNNIQGVPRGIGGETWTWLVNNWWQGGTRTTAYNGFLNANSRDVPGMAIDPSFYNGFSRHIWSSQVPQRRFMFGGNKHITDAGYGCNWFNRWGWTFNENGYALVGPGDYNGLGSCDCSGGIGLNSTGASAGDYYGCCAAGAGTLGWSSGSIGFNRQMRCEIYGR